MVLVPKLFLYVPCSLTDTKASKKPSIGCSVVNFAEVCPFSSDSYASRLEESIHIKNVEIGPCFILEVQFVPKSGVILLDCYSGLRPGRATGDTNMCAGTCWHLFGTVLYQWLAERMLYTAGYLSSFNKPAGECYFQ